MNNRNILLKVKDLEKEYLRTRGALRKRAVGVVKAVDKINFFIEEGETLAWLERVDVVRPPRGDVSSARLNPPPVRLPFK